MRLNQFIAHAGICSRRKADKLIESGAIKINNAVAQHPGMKVHSLDKVMYKDQLLKLESKIYIVFNKPINCITTLRDPQGRSTFKHYLPRGLPRIYPVGRLDRNTYGVLLITNDGYLAKALTHPAYEVYKVYEVTLKQKLSFEELHSIRSGIMLVDGLAMVDSIEALNTEYTKFRLRLHSGKNRIIRRLFQTINHQILSLRRTSFAGITASNLTVGRWRYLSRYEVDMLRDIVH